MKDSMGGSLKFEADFFRKSNNLSVSREKKIRSIQVRTAHLLLLLALALLTSWMIYKAASFLFTWEALQVHSFRLRNQPVFAGEEAAGILRRSAGNILAMDLKALRAQLLLIPEVADASIQRALPDTVEIDFTLRRPFYQHYQDGSYRLLDASGRVLGRQRLAPDGLVPVRADGDPPMTQIAAFSEELRPLREQIEYVSFSEPYGVELKLRGAPEVFFPGEDDFAGKIRRYFRIKGRLTVDGAAIVRVDLRIPGRIYFECDETQRGNP